MAASKSFMEDPEVSKIVLSIFEDAATRLRPEDVPGASHSLPLGRLSTDGNTTRAVETLREEPFDVRA